MPLSALSHTAVTSASQVLVSSLIEDKVVELWEYSNWYALLLLKISARQEMVRPCA